MSGVAANHVASKVLASADLKTSRAPVDLSGGRIDVMRRTLATTFPPVTMTMTSPDGSTRTLTLNQTSPGG